MPGAARSRRYRAVRWRRSKLLDGEAGRALVPTVVGTFGGDGTSYGCERCSFAPRGALVLCACALVVVSCTSSPEPDGASPSPTPAPATTSALWGQTFVSTGVSSGGEPVQLFDDVRVQVTFEERDDSDDVVRWRADCNAVGAPVEFRGDRLVTGQISSTAIGCPDDPAARDRWLSDFFDDDPRWTFEDDELTLASGDARIELRSRDSAPGGGNAQSQTRAFTVGGATFDAPSHWLVQDDEHVKLCLDQLFGDTPGIYLASRPPATDCTGQHRAEPSTAPGIYAFSWSRQHLPLIGYGQPFGDLVYREQISGFDAHIATKGELTNITIHDLDIALIVSQRHDAEVQRVLQSLRPAEPGSDSPSPTRDRTEQGLRQ